MGVQLSCNREYRDRGSNGRRPPLLFIAYQHGEKSLPKIAMEFFLREPATGPPVHGRPGPKSDAGGGPSFHTRAGRLGGVAYPDTPGAG